VLEAGNAVVHRFATAFGASPRMRLNLLPNDFVHQAVTRGSLVVYEGHAQRTFIHVLDMARGIAFALREWTLMADDIYNIGDESLNMSKAELAYAIQRHVNYYVHFADVGSDADCRYYAVSCEKIHRKGFATVVDLDAGIAELVQASKLVG
jgi:nucleoside-diphosphate-sugar epimerase